MIQHLYLGGQWGPELFKRGHSPVKFVRQMYFLTQTDIIMTFFYPRFNKYFAEGSKGPDLGLEGVAFPVPSP